MHEALIRRTQAGRLIGHISRDATAIAAQVWNIADQHFPGAVQIVDLFYARQHLWEVARILYPGDPLRQKQWILRHQPKLDGGKIEKLAQFLRRIDASTPAAADVLRIEAAYFENNAERMRYPEFRLQHLFVGSGVIEAGCKNRHRLPPQTVWYVLDGQRSKRHHRPSLLPP